MGDGLSTAESDSRVEAGGGAKVCLGLIRQPQEQRERQTEIEKERDEEEEDVYIENLASSSLPLQNAAKEIFCSWF